MKNSTQELIDIAFTPINPIEDLITGYSAWFLSMNLIGLQIYAISTGLQQKNSLGENKEQCLI